MKKERFFEIVSTYMCEGDKLVAELQEDLSTTYTLYNSVNAPLCKWNDESGEYEKF